MNSQMIEIADISVSNDAPMVLFGGMNVLESRDMAMGIAEAYVKATKSWVFPMFQGVFR